MSDESEELRKEQARSEWLMHSEAPDSEQPHLTAAHENPSWLPSVSHANAPVSLPGTHSVAVPGHLNTHPSPEPVVNGQPSTQTRKFGGYQIVVLGVVSWLVFIICACWFGDPEWQKLERAKSWPVSGGKVTDMKQVVVSSSRNGKTFGVQIFYDYQVGGSHYTGVQDRFLDHPGGDPTKRWDGKTYPEYNPYQSTEIINAFPIGKEVRVSYNPFDNGESFIDTNVSPMLLIEKIMRWTGMLLVVLIFVAIFNMGGFPLLRQLSKDVSWARVRRY